MKLKVYAISVTTTGSAGSAAGTGTAAIWPAGYLEWVYYDYHASAPNTTDITGTMSGAMPGGTVFTRSNSATDALVYPRAAAIDTAASAITNSGERIALTGTLTVTLAQCDALTDAVTVYVGVNS